jgi:hypothetical protein
MSYAYMERPVLENPVPPKRRFVPPTRVVQPAPVITAPVVAPVKVQTKRQRCDDYDDLAVELPEDADEPLIVILG